MIVIFNEEVLLNGKEHKIRLSCGEDCLVNANFDGGQEFAVKDSGGVPTKVPRVVLLELVNFAELSTTRRFAIICIKRAARQMFSKETVFRVRKGQK